MSDSRRLMGKEVLVVSPKGEEKIGFLAFCDDEKGITIKSLETQETILCLDIREWDFRRKIARKHGVDILYRNNGRYVHEYLKECIRVGIIHGAFVESDLKNHKAKAIGTLSPCPTGL